MFMFNGFTEGAQHAMVLAQEEAQRLNHRYIGTEHLLLGLIRGSSGAASSTLENLGAELEYVRQEVEKVVPRGEESTLGEKNYTSRLKKSLELAIEESQILGHSHIGTEHLLLGLFREGEGVAYGVLKGLGMELQKTRKEIMQMLGKEQGGGGESSSGKYHPKPQTPTVDTYGRDLTRLYREGKLDPVIGREREMERLVQILIRRTKNNPCLVGEAGVGKTAVVEGLASRIQEEKVPEMLRDKRVVSLELSALIAGTKYRGEFEERMLKLLEELRQAKNIIIFIDEMHTIIGAGAVEGAIDASNILKPALARGEIQCIGATTQEEYRKHVERSPALERRFQPVRIDEPTERESREILEGLKERYETHHRVSFSDNALKAAVRLSGGYLSDRHLPDKAIDVIDEAGARVRINAPSADAEASVEEEDIAEIVSSWTGVPVKRLTEEESRRLIRLEEELHRRIVGQDEAVGIVSRAVRRSRTGMKDPRRPVGSFIFLGPSGVGKTELARTLAHFLFGEEKFLIRMDMSEYMEKHAVSRLIGSPPGYVGHDEGGQLTEKVRRHPYSVILMDEIEKAHPEVFNILLQVLEEGRLTDSKGKEVDFRHTILIMTSNLGGQYLDKPGVIGFRAEGQAQEYYRMKHQMMDELKKTFRPEFLNRLDEAVVFHALAEEHYYQIADLMLEEMNQRMKSYQMELETTARAKKQLVQKSMHSGSGARTLRVHLQKQLEDGISEEMLKGRLNRGDLVLVDVENQEMVFKKKERTTVK